MSGPVANHGYNIGLEITQCYQKYFDYRETELNKLIDNLKVSNIQIKIISDVTNKLAHSKSKKVDWDPSEYLPNEADTKKLIYLVALRNSSIFDDKLHNMPVDHISLEETLNTIIDQLRKEGVPDENIHLGMILEKVTYDPNIRFDPINEAGIDVVIQGMDAELKSLNADLNKQLMDINSKYEDRSQMTENARQVLKEADELNKSIIQKTGRGG